ncbi:glycosyltransferase [Actinosynnema sp. NPDC047251]|uniref:Glycosyltransferase-like protein n=1 Tax=Saccharothrix espanaensis (strain ATCC 51144 / DSM 44229 / JCM 9112 / NBRC 15066 / NRRL 15764) TaxID=1179773 RepID=K0K1G6_SACES|nr:glycosyltransferase [Saccharothrix espanaensis]CCH31412.1 Glycosyltransferase-like protein [Saccharothrix espanaensis DSM 44229]
MTGHFVVPDSRTPSGGNTYNRRAGGGLRPVVVAGAWPRPDDAARAALHRALAGLPDGAPVLLDGLVACGVPEVVTPHADRLRLAVLVHLPLAEETGLDPAVAAELDAAERACLRAVHAVVATGAAAGERLAAHHGLGRVHVVAPGVDPAPLAPGGDGVSSLLCVASITPRKGHDVLVEALARVADRPWTCVCAGPADPGHARSVRAAIARHGLAERIDLVGPLLGADLDAAYAAADLFVLPSRAETYGMAVAEALARGIPVLASAVPDALGDGGWLLPGDAASLADALRRWFDSARTRAGLRDAARARRRELSTWEETVLGLAAVLASLRT